MNKDEAANYLGCSVRALERYTQKGRLGASYVKGKTRPTVEYREEDLRAFKVELDAELYPQRPAVERPPAENSANLAHNPAALATLGNTAPLGDVQELVSMIVRESVKESVSAALEASDAERERFTAALETIAAQGQHGPAPAVPIADKVMLTLTDAAALSSLSRGHLTAAIHAGKLKAQILGKGFKIKRSDLDSYVQKL